MSNSLEILQKTTIAVADTGDFKILEENATQDATTNPSHILKVAIDPKFQYLIDEACQFAKSKSDNIEEQIEWAADKVCVNFGIEILKRIPGRVSTEVDARLSFDKENSVKKALRIIEMYKTAGIDKQRILIKLGSTWEGIQAAKELEAEHGIKTNLTLLFSFAQAVACAEAKVQLISPFVGRANDWWAEKNGRKYTAAEEATSPGVVLVKRIFNYYRKFGYDTEIMGASFRNIDQVKALCGIDLMTMWPKFIDDLRVDQDTFSAVCTKAGADASDEVKLEMTEANFRWMHNQDRMAVEQVSNGIRLFAVDQGKLDDMLRKRLQ